MRWMPVLQTNSDSGQTEVDRLVSGLARRACPVARYGSIGGDLGIAHFGDWAVPLNAARVCHDHYSAGVRNECAVATSHGNACQRHAAACHGDSIGYGGFWPGG